MTLPNTSPNALQPGQLSDTERYLWAVYHIFVLLSSLVGDSLVLFASFQRNAFKLNKFIVTIIQFIAVSDLVYAIFSVVPRTVSLLADSHKLGEFELVCYITVYMSYFNYSAGMSLVAVLTTAKFLLLRYPTKSSNWTEKMAVKACCLILIPPLLFPVLFLIVDKDDIAFDFKIFTCNYKFTSEIWAKLKGIVFIVTLLIPNIITVATTIPTLMYLAAARKSAKRVRGSVPWQGALTVALTAIVYCFSTLPNFVYHILEREIQESSLFQFPYYRISESLLMINIISNFYIYTLTIRSFRRFLFSKILSVVQISFKDSRNATSAGENFLAPNLENRDI